MMILLFTIILLTGCIFQREYTGFYYADNIREESSQVIKEGLKSLPECKAWIHNISKGNTNFDYKCGYGCNIDEKYNLYICKETLK